MWWLLRSFHFPQQFRFLHIPQLDTSCHQQALLSLTPNIDSTDCTSISYGLDQGRKVTHAREQKRSMPEFERRALIGHMPKELSMKGLLRIEEGIEKHDPRDTEWSDRS